LDWNKRRLYRPYPAKQSAYKFLCIGCSRAEATTNWIGRETREATEEKREEKKRKRRQLVTDSLPKKKKKGAKACHECEILASQTRADTLPSFLDWRKLRSLTFLSLVSHHKS